jgi:hypothetical protein
MHVILWTFRSYILSTSIQFKSRPSMLSTSFEVCNLNGLELCGEGGKGKDEH